MLVNIIERLDNSVCYLSMTIGQTLHIGGRGEKKISLADDETDLSFYLIPCQWAN